MPSQTYTNLFKAIIEKVKQTDAIAAELKELISAPEMDINRIKDLFNQLSDCQQSIRLESFS